MVYGHGQGNLDPKIFLRRGGRRGETKRKKIFGGGRRGDRKKRFFRIKSYRGRKHLFAKGGRGVGIIRAGGQLFGARRGARRPPLLRKKEDEEERRQASSIRSTIRQDGKCDVGRYDVGIIRAGGQLFGARRGARRPPLLRKKEDEEERRQALSIRSQIG